MSIQIRQELLAIKGGEELLRVDDVIDWARKHKDSALFKEYEWDVKKAAREHWRDTTRRLIALHVTYETGERRLVSLSIDRSRPGGGYRDVDDVRNAPDLMSVMLEDALRDFERFRQKYERCLALAPVFEAAETIKSARAPKQEERRASA